METKTKVDNKKLEKILSEIKPKKQTGKHWPPIYSDEVYETILKKIINGVQQAQIAKAMEIDTKSLQSGLWKYCYRQYIKILKEKL